MSKINFLVDQIIESRNFVNRLIAETKYEAISWCFKHEMWHSAEMEAIKRDLGHSINWL